MSTFRRLLGFLRPYRRQVIGSLVFAWAAMGMTVLIPWLVGQAVDAIQSQDRDELMPLALAIVGAGILRLGLTVIRRLIAGKVSLGVEFDLRERFYGHLQTLELGYFDGQQTGQLMSRGTVDLQGIRFFLGYGLIFLTQNALTILLASAVMIAIEPWLALLALAPVPFVVISAMRFNRLSRPALQEVQQRIAELTADAEEGVSGIRVVKAFAREEHMLDRFRRSVARVFDQNVYSTRLRAFYSPLLGFLPSLGLAAVLLVGGREVISGGLTLGEFAAFYTYVLMLTGPMRMLGMVLGMAQRAIASGNRLFEVLDREPRIASRPGAPPLPPGPGLVELRGVSLAYDGAEPALSDADLVVPPGRTVALVGPTGSGKTSLVALLARLYDPTAGSVMVDGVDVRDVDLRSLRSEIAFVADDSFLFSATIAENIAYARADASMEEIERAARRAQAHEFIERLPNGYETLVGERGLTLSGGQRQRIAIARALVADPRILILDDATSSVDARTEARIREGLREAMAGRTTFIVAHRLSTISLADEIVVVDEGRIVDRGTHDELMERCSLYREIAEHGLEDSVFLQRDLEEREELAQTVSTPEEQVRTQTGEGTETASDGRLRSIWLLVVALWRLIRGEDDRGRKLRWLLALLRPYRARVWLMMLALLTATAAGLAPPYLAGRAVDDGIVAGDETALLAIVGVFIASALVFWGATYAQTYLVGWVGQRALQDLRQRIFAHLQGMSIGFFTRNRPGVLISRLTNDVSALDTLVTDGIVTLFSSTLTLIGVVIILLLLDVPLALVTFITFPLLAIGSVAFRIVAANAYKATRVKIANITAHLQETLSGVRVVRSFAQEGRHVDRMTALNEENRVANMKTVYLNASYFPAVELLSAVGTAVILLYGGYRVIDGDILIGTIVAFVGYLQAFFDPIQQISQLYTTYQQGMAALDKIFELLDTEPDMVDRPGALEPGRIRGEIELEDVSFSYALDAKSGRAHDAGAVEEGEVAEFEDLEELERHRDWALREVDLHVPPGQTVALVGATGAGKSTLAKLVARFYDPQQGRVLIDGQDLRDLKATAVAVAARDRAAGGLPVLGDGAGEHRLRAPGRERRGDPRGGGDGRRGCVHRAAAERIRHRDRRARDPAIGRPASAGRVRPRAGRRSADPDPRRGDLERGRAHGEDDRARTGAAARRPDGAGDRAPPVDDPPRGADRGSGGRRDRRVGQPRRADRRRRAVLAALRSVVGTSGLSATG